MLTSACIGGVAKVPSVQLNYQSTEVDRCSFANHARRVDQVICYLRSDVSARPPTICRSNESGSSRLSEEVLDQL